MRMTGLTEGDAYTVWTVIFKNPTGWMRRRRSNESRPHKRHRSSGLRIMVGSRSTLRVGDALTATLIGGCVPNTCANIVMAKHN